MICELWLTEMDTLKKVISVGHLCFKQDMLGERRSWNEEWCHSPINDDDCTDYSDHWYKAVHPDAKQLKYGPEMKRQWRKTLDGTIVPLDDELRKQDNLTLQPVTENLG